MQAPDQDRSTRESRIPARDFVTLTGVAFLMTMAALIFGHHQDFLLYDPNAYVGGAEAIAAGQGYRFLGYVGQPVVGIYPPGTSLFLSLFWDLNRTLGENLSVIRWANHLLAAGAMALIGCWMRGSQVPLPASIFFMSQIAFSAGWRQLADLPLSDPGFMLWILIAILPWNPAFGGDWRRPAWVWFGSGVALSMAYLWRTAAIPWIGIGVLACAVAAWKSRRWQPLVFLLGLLLMAIGPWLTQGAVSYADNFRIWETARLSDDFWINVRWNNIRELATGKSLGYSAFATIIPYFESASRRLGLTERVSDLGIMIAGLLLLLGAAFHLARRTRAADRWIALGLMGYLAIFLTSPITLSLFLGERYFFVAAPLLIGWAWQAFGKQPCLVRQTWLGIAATLATALTIAGGVRNWRIHAPGKVPSETKIAFDAAAAWLRNHGEPGAVAIGVECPALELREASGRMLVVDYFKPAPKVFMPILVLHRQQGYAPARYLLIEDPDDPRLQDPTLPIRRVSGMPGKPYAVFEVVPSAEPAWRAANGIPPPESSPIRSPTSPASGAR